MVINKPDLIQNKILQALPPIDFELISSHLKLVFLHLGEVLHEQGGRLFYIYFPIDCLISLLYMLENGSSVEIATIGDEGAMGIPQLMGDMDMPILALVRSPGYAYRIPKNLLIEEFYRRGVLHHNLLKYLQLFINQTIQASVCYRFHTIEQQLCRWLLERHNRFLSDELKYTQELIGRSLGVRRESITESIGKLQKAGIIHSSRGQIKIINREGMEARACECYTTLKKESDRLTAA